MDVGYDRTVKPAIRATSWGLNRMLSVHQALGIVRPDLVKFAADERLNFEDRDQTFRSVITAFVKSASAEVQRSCMDHARFWGIEGECRAALDRLSKHADPGIPASCYALPEHQKLACYDADSTVASATALYDARNTLPYELRKTAAVRIAAATERYSANMPDYLTRHLHKVAGWGAVTPESLQDAVFQRLELVVDDQVRSDLLKVASVLDEQPELSVDPEFVKVAISTLSDLDEQTGLTAHYGTRIGTPENVVSEDLTLDVLSKIAEYQESVTLVNGRQVDLTKISRDALSAVDPSLAEMSDSRLAEVLPTLPRGDADLLTRLAGI